MKWTHERPACGRKVVVGCEREKRSLSSEQIKDTGNNNNNKKKKRGEKGKTKSRQTGRRSEGSHPSLFPSEPLLFDCFGHKGLKQKVKDTLFWGFSISVKTVATVACTLSVFLIISTVVI